MLADYLIKQDFFQMLHPRVMETNWYGKKSINLPFKNTSYAIRFPNRS